jgi:hypothetical protein
MPANFMNGVAARKHASVQLDKCTTASNKQQNVLASESAVVSHSGCTDAGSFGGSGWVARMMAQVWMPRRQHSKETS